MKSKRSKTGGALQLEGLLTIAEAAALHRVVLEAMPEHGDLRVELRDVERVDVTALQILLAAARTLGERGDRLIITDADSALRRAAEIHGLQHHEPFVTPEVTPAETSEDVK